MHQLIVDAVRSRLSLSSGLDSSALAYALAKELALEEQDAMHARSGALRSVEARVQDLSVLLQ